MVPVVVEPVVVVINGVLVVGNALVVVSTVVAAVVVIPVVVGSKVVGIVVVSSVADEVGYALWPKREFAKWHKRSALIGSEIINCPEKLSKHLGIFWLGMEFGNAVS